MVRLRISLQLINAHFSSFLVPSLSVTDVIAALSFVPGTVASVPGIFMLVLPAGQHMYCVFALL